MCTTPATKGNPRQQHAHSSQSSPGLRLRRRPRHRPWHPCILRRQPLTTVGAQLANVREVSLTRVASRGRLHHPRSEGFEPSTPSFKARELTTCSLPLCCVLHSKKLYLKCRGHTNTEEKDLFHHSIFSLFQLGRKGERGFACNKI